ncbi:hypothetical protein OIV83_000102 [Microbotryomycetes sp. JL201]|nr:hypothetical protein OIV83_000102 [Microbotryomycetes sp. JL201]
MATAVLYRAESAPRLPLPDLPSPSLSKHTQSQSNGQITEDVSDESDMDTWASKPARSPGGSSTAAKRQSLGSPRSTRRRSRLHAPDSGPEDDDDSDESTVQDLTRELADLSNWAPDRPVKLTSTKFAHLPPVHLTSTVSTLDLRGGAPTTSKPIPNLTPLQASISHSLNRLLSPAIFQQFLATPKGYDEFHRYLSQVSNSSTHIAALELWRNLNALEFEQRRTALAAEGIRDLYLLPSGPVRATDILTAEDFTSAVGSLAKVTQAATGLDEVSKHLLERLYRDEFGEYVKHYLIRHTSVELGKYGVTAKDRQGLGEAFVMSNPRLHDQPIVLASDAFCLLTGYDREMIIGRNCRFLQGDATSPESVKNIRAAIDRGEECTELLLNYRADGTPFWNLLCILPLRDTKGQVTYFVGGQTNITGTVAKGSGTDLSFILGSDEPIMASDTKSRSSTGWSHPNVTRYSSALEAWMKPREHDGDAPEPENSTVNAPARDLQPMPTSRKATMSSSAIERQSAAARWRLPFLKRSKRPNNSGLNESQLLDSAEMFRKRDTGKTGGIESRISQFTATYEKVLILRRHSREILFATPSFLRFCGLPGASLVEMCSSKLLHQDVLKIIGGGATQNVADRKSTRSTVKKTMKEGTSVTLLCWIQVKEMGVYGREGFLPAAKGVLHLTPLKDLKGDVSAYVAMTDSLLWRKMLVIFVAFMLCRLTVAAASLAVAAEGPKRVATRNTDVHTRAVGSVSLTEDASDLSYAAPAMIGGQSLQLVLDTGSSDLVVATHECADCEGQVYDSTASTSATVSTTPFSIQYGSGSANGMLVTDSVALDTFTVAQQTFGACADFDNLLGGSESGLLGLGWQSLAMSGATPFAQHLWQSGSLDEPMFGLALRSGDGTLTLGGIDSAAIAEDVNWVSLEQTNSYWEIPLDGVRVNGVDVGITTNAAIIDSGTSLMSMPASAVQSIYAAISPEAYESSGLMVYPCSANATISLSFGGVYYTVPPESFAYGNVDSDGTSCWGSVYDASEGTSDLFIIGGAFLQHVYSAFRFDPPAIGFANLASAQSSIDTVLAEPTQSASVALPEVASTVPIVAIPPTLSEQMSETPSALPTSTSSPASSSAETIAATSSSSLTWTSSSSVAPTASSSVQVTVETPSQAAAGAAASLKDTTSSAAATYASCISVIFFGIVASFMA